MFTARIRRMGKVIVSLCLSVHTPAGVPTLGGGYLPWLVDGGIPTLAGGWGRGTPRYVPPIQGRYPPGQVRIGGTPRKVLPPPPQPR